MGRRDKEMVRHAVDTESYEQDEMHYTARASTWDSLTYSRNIAQYYKAKFAVSIPNVWGTIAKLVTQDLQP